MVKRLALMAAIHQLPKEQCRIQLLRFENVLFLTRSPQRHEEGESKYCTFRYLLIIFMPYAYASSAVYSKLH